MFASKIARSATLSLAVAAVISSIAVPATAGVTIFGGSEDKQQVQLPDFVKLVEDNGPAISDEAFGRMKRVSDSVKEDGLGLGLGAGDFGAVGGHDVGALVQQDSGVAEAHGGGGRRCGRRGACGEGGHKAE